MFVDNTFGFETFVDAVCKSFPYMNKYITPIKKLVKKMRPRYFRMIVCNIFAKKTNYDFFHITDIDFHSNNRDLATNKTDTTLT
jgi:hypothetical protein